jgi:hypothetical protein
MTEWDKTAKGLCIIANNVINPTLYANELYNVILTDILDKAFIRAIKGYFYLEYTTENYYNGYPNYHMDDIHGKLLFEFKRLGYGITYTEHPNKTITYILGWNHLYFQ